MWNTTWIGDSARLVADIYYHAELALLRKMAGDMAELSAVDDADVVSLRRLLDFEIAAGQVYSEAHWLVLADMEDLLDGLQAQEYATATGNLAELGYAPRVMPDQISAVELIAADMARTVSAIPPRAFRDAVDAYQQVQAYASGQVALGVLTRLDASQWALDELARQGMTKMTDRAGRNWHADTYAEMTVRTGAMNAMIETHLDAYQQHGVDLVLVSDSAHECDMCRPWEFKVLSMSGTAGRYQVADQLTGGTTMVDVAGNIGDARAQGLFHPNCFPAGTLVQTTADVRAADARWYEGDLVIIETASGDNLSVTPNHPILTPEGWVEAGSLREGMNVLRHNAWDQASVGTVPDEVNVPTSIDDVHRALKESGTVATVSVPVAALDFHGDGTVNTEVEIVFRDSLLQDDLMTVGADGAGESSLSVRGMGLSSLLTEGTLRQVLVGAGHATDSVMRVPHHRGSLIGAHAGGTLHGSGTTVGLDPVSAKHTRNRGLTSSDDLPDLGLGVAPFVPEADGLSVPGGLRLVPGAERGGLGDGAADTGVAEALLDVRLADIEVGRELGHTLSSEVSASQIVQINRRNFAGHVYNLETSNHWYVAESIIVHNCTHNVTPYIPGATRDLPTRDDPVVYEATQDQRRIERHIRDWKRRHSVSVTPGAYSKASAKLEKWEQELKDLLDDYPELRRRPERENPFSAR